MSSSDQILQRISSIPRQNSWFIFIVAQDQQLNAIEELEESISIFLEEPINVISADAGLKKLLEKIYTSDTCILLWGFEKWTAQDWNALDYERSRLSRENGGFLLLTSETAASLQRHAPNFLSFIGSKIYDLELGTELLTESEREQRLEVLQLSLGKTNDEVIHLAESGELTPDPVYGEWLVLLNRGDLVGR
jgi:hypothetical protein